MPVNKLSKDKRRQYKKANREAHKEKLMQGEQEGRYGEVWVWSAIDPVSKYLFPDAIGSRTQQCGIEVLQTVRARRKNIHDLLLIQSDNFGSYESLIKTCFSQEVLQWKHKRNGEKIPVKIKMPDHILYAVLQKKRNQQGEIEEIDSRVVFGTPDKILQVLQAHNPTHGINTSFIERLNLNRRLFNSRLRRKTLTFSKDYHCFKAQLNLQRVYANFCWSHHSLKKINHSPMSPAMAIGATQRIWSLADILAYPLI